MKKILIIALGALWLFPLGAVSGKTGSEKKTTESEHVSINFTKIIGAIREIYKAYNSYNLEAKKTKPIDELKRDITEAFLEDYAISKQIAELKSAILKINELKDPLKKINYLMRSKETHPEDALLSLRRTSMIARVNKKFRDLFNETFHEKISSIFNEVAKPLQERKENINLLVGTEPTQGVRSVPQNIALQDLGEQIEGIQNIEETFFNDVEGMIQVDPNVGEAFHNEIQGNIQEIERNLINNLGEDLFAEIQGIIPPAHNQNAEALRREEALRALRDEMEQSQIKSYPYELKANLLALYGEVCVQEGIIPLFDAILTDDGVKVLSSHLPYINFGQHNSFIELCLEKIALVQGNVPSCLILSNSFQSFFNIDVRIKFEIRVQERSLGTFFYPVEDDFECHSDKSSQIPLSFIKIRTKFKEDLERTLKTGKYENSDALIIHTLISEIDNLNSFLIDNNHGPDTLMANVLSIRLDKSFAYDIMDSPHSRQSILRDLRSDAKNFRGGCEVENFEYLLDGIINKGKQYFGFFISYFMGMGKDWGSHLFPFFYMERFLLNDNDSNWKPGYETLEKRRALIGDIFERCTNNSSLYQFEKEGKQNLRGAQHFPMGCIAHKGLNLLRREVSGGGYVDTINVMQDHDPECECMFKFCDIATGDEIIYHFMDALSYAHNGAEKHLAWISFEATFLDHVNLTNKNLFFQYFWHREKIISERGNWMIYCDSQERDCRLGVITYFDIFIKENPHLVMSDYEEKKERVIQLIGESQFKTYWDEKLFSKSRAFTRYWNCNCVEWIIRTFSEEDIKSLYQDYQKVKLGEIDSQEETDLKRFSKEKKEDS